MPDKVAFVAERASAMADNAPGLKFRLRLPLSRDRRHAVGAADVSTMTG